MVVVACPHPAFFIVRMLRIPDCLQKTFDPRGPDLIRYTDCFKLLGSIDIGVILANIYRTNPIVLVVMSNASPIIEKY
jgi:hypothetical protein